MSLTRHPFLSFEYSIASLPARTWMLMGDAFSKCQQLAQAPLRPQLANEFMATYMAKGAQSTTAIEGNTLTDDEVRKIFDKGTADVPPSREYLEVEVRNVVNLLRELDSMLMQGYRMPIDSNRLQAVNLGVLRDLSVADYVAPGQLREVDVVAGPYAAPHYSDVPDMVERFCKWLVDLRGNQSAQRPADDRFVAALLSAILAHLYIAWIHPFGDGNGRTARLVEVQILSESGVVPLASTNILSDFYNKTRSAYYRALNDAQRDPNAFVTYAVQGFLDELTAQVARVSEENLEVNWRSYVYEVFDAKPNTEARARQRTLALTIQPGQIVTPEDVSELTPTLARLYAVCGDRIPARDLNDLVKMGLATKVGKRQYRANHELIQRLIPPVSD